MFKKEVNMTSLHSKFLNMVHVMCSECLQSSSGVKEDYHKNQKKLIKLVDDTKKFMKLPILYFLNTRNNPGMFDSFWAKGSVTKLKNRSDVHSMLLGAVENDFQVVIQKESYEIARDL